MALQMQRHTIIILLCIKRYNRVIDSPPAASHSTLWLLWSGVYVLERHFLYHDLQDQFDAISDISPQSRLYNTLPF